MTWRSNARACATNQRKSGIQFRGTAGDVHGGNVGALQRHQAPLHGLASHYLAPVRTGVDVAVLAGLVAELAYVDLEDGDPGGGQWGQAGTCQGRLKRLEPIRRVENPQLFLRGS